MVTIKKRIATIIFLTLFSAAAIVSCNKPATQETPATEVSSDSTDHPADSTEHPADSTEHPAGEHPDDSTKN